MSSGCRTLRQRRQRQNAAPLPFGPDVEADGDGWLPPGDWFLAVEPAPQPLVSVATAIAAAAPRIALRAKIIDMATSFLVTRPRGGCLLEVHASTPAKVHRLVPDPASVRRAAAHAPHLGQQREQSLRL